MPLNMRTYSGFNERTAENLQLDAGAFFKNFDIESDTFESAVADGKLLGATSGGGEFTAKATFRQIAVDGVKGKAKGLEVIDQWDVNIKANVIEVTEENLIMALGTGSSKVSPDSAYSEISGSQYVFANDYIDNITWVGTHSGSDMPIVIQVLNAISMDGLTMTIQDKNNAILSLNFFGHYDPTELDNPPFRIYFPASLEAR